MGCAFLRSRFCHTAIQRNTEPKNNAITERLGDAVDAALRSL
jgi:hypothetical protein